MSQAPVSTSDARRRHEKQAYDVSYLGMSKETGPTGIKSRMSASAQYAVYMEADASIATAQAIGDLTRGVWSLTAILHEALPATSTLTLTLPAEGGLGAVVLLNASDATVVGAKTLDIPILAPFAIDRPLTMTIANGGANTAKVSLLVTPQENGWF